MRAGISKGLLHSNIPAIARKAASPIDSAETTRGADRGLARARQPGRKAIAVVQAIRCIGGAIATARLDGAQTVTRQRVFLMAAAHRPGIVSVGTNTPIYDATVIATAKECCA